MEVNILLVFIYIIRFNTTLLSVTVTRCWCRKEWWEFMWWNYAPDPLKPAVLVSDWLLGHIAAFSFAGEDPSISSLHPRSPPRSSSCLILSKTEYRVEESWTWLISWLMVSWKGFFGIITLLMLWGWIEADLRGWGWAEVTALSSNETQLLWLMMIGGECVRPEWWYWLMLRREAPRVSRWPGPALPGTGQTHQDSRRKIQSRSRGGDRVSDRDSVAMISKHVVTWAFTNVCNSSFPIKFLAFGN